MKRTTIPINYTSLLALMVDPKGIIRFVTKPMAQILGYSITDLIGKNFLNELITEGERESSANEINHIQEKIVNFNKPLLSRENELIDFRLQLVTVKNNFLNTYNTVLVSDNIIYGNLIKNALSAPQNNLRELFELANELIILLNSEKEIVYTNPRWKEKIGFLNKIGTAHNLEVCFDENNRLVLENALNKLNKQSNSESISLSIRSKLNGKMYHLTGYATVENKDNKPFLYQFIFNDVTEEVRAEKVNNLYYNISSQIVGNVNLPSIYKSIHTELMEVIECKNLYIALHTPESSDSIVFPYFIENGGENRGVIKRKISNGITEYAINKGTPLRISKEEFKHLKESGTITILGEIPEHWLGVPLTISGRVIGVLAVQSYEPEIKYTQKDLELLDFASSQIALAIEIVRTREELQNQTARLNSIFESSSHLIWSVNKELEVTSFNKNYFDANFINYDANPKIVEGNSNQLKSFKKFWAEKYKKAFKGEKLEFEIKLKNDKNIDIWKEIHLSPIYTDPNRIDEVSGIAHDVTQKKRSELALLKSEEKFRNIFESFQDLYFRCDLKGNLLMVSPSVYELTGYQSNEVIGRHIDDYYLYNPRIKSILKELRTSKNLKNVEVSIVKQNSEVRQCICNIRMVQNNKNEPFEIEGVVRDITQLKITNQQLIEANETAENSLRVKEQFLANMSHEIRTPMNGIIGMIDLLEESKLDKKQHDYIATLKKSSSILLEILNDILDLSKIEAGRMELKPITFSLEKLVDKIHTLFTPIASTNRVNLHYHINKAVPKNIIADETRLMQVLSNLISNSLKFTEKGGSVDIGFELVQQDNKKVLLRVDVRDSGIGISHEDQKLLFTNFTQLDNTSTKSYSGTGLGLAISKQLVNLLGGNIGVFSNPGLGSTFWFTFKAIVSEAKPMPPKTVKSFQSKTIDKAVLTHSVLIVDDNLINREVAGEILSQVGCKVKLAQSGKEAIELISTNNFDVVFMDIQMPQMDGIETTIKIKQLGLTHEPKIIAMTAYAMKEDEDKFISQGMDDYLPKPIRAKQLIGKVKKWTGGSLENIENNPNSVENLTTVINTTTLRQLRKYGGEELIDTVYFEFETETLDQLDECKKALSKNKWEDIQKLLHTIKGTSGTLGIEKVSEKARQIEYQLKHNNIKEINKDFSELLDNFVEFQDNFKAIIRNN